MCKKKLMLFMCLVSGIGWADYVKPEKNVEVADGVYARESAAKDIEKYNIRDKVLKLYNETSVLDRGVTLAKDSENCFHIIIDTKNKKKNFIKQIIQGDEKCSTH